MAERGGESRVPVEQWIPERPFDSAEYLDGQAPGYEGKKDEPKPEDDQPDE